MNKLKYIYCAILTAFVTGLQASVSKSIPYEIFNEHKELKESYKVLLSKFAKDHFELYTINIVISKENCSICDRILGALMKVSMQSFVTINDIESSNNSVMKNATELVPHIGYYKCVAFLTESINDFFQHFAKLRLMYAWNPRARHVILTVEKPEDKELEMIFREAWTYKVLNVAVIIRNHEEAYTYNPYLKNHSEMREKVFDWSKLFYDKLRNMNGLSIPTRYIPYGGRDVAKWIEEESRFKFYGTDYGYAKAFFKSVNATPGFINLTNDLVPCYKNFTYRYEIWNERKFGGAELWMNFMPLQITLKNRTERTYPLQSDSIRILVGKSGLKRPNIFEPYDNITWASVVLSLVTFVLYSCVFYKLRGIDDNAFFRTLAIFLGKNLAKRRYGFFEKITFYVFSMYSFLMLSAYQGSLYGALATFRHYPEIDTLPELYERTKSIHTFTIIVDYFRTYVEPRFKVVEFDTNDYVKYMGNHRDGAYAFTNIVGEYIVKLKKLSENGVPFYHVMSEFSIPDFVTHTLPYGSPYLEKLERVLLACKEAGLSEYWQAEANLNAILSGTIIPNEPEGRTLKKLSLQALLYGFYVWGIGLLISSLCFAVEIYSHKNGKTNVPRL